LTNLDRLAELVEMYAEALRTLAQHEAKPE